MNDKTAEIIRQLADKLGVTAEHLWGVLVRQAPITAFMNIVLSFVLIIAAAFTFKWLLKKTKAPELADDGVRGRPDIEDEAAISLWLFFGLLCIPAVVMVCAAIYEIPTAILNPEYWALKQLLDR